MNKEEKLNEIKALTKDLSEASNLYLADISGLNASETSDLRRTCFSEKIKLQVVKNT